MLSRKRTSLLLMVAVIVTAILPVLLVAKQPVLPVAKEWQPTQAYRETVNRIKALSKIRGLSSQEKLERVQELKETGQEIERKWREENVETYARLTFKVCATLGSLDFGTHKKSYFAQSFAMRALGKADEFPLEVECKLLGYVGQRYDANGNTLKGEAWSALRKKQAELRLHAWQRVEKTIDPNWDPKDTGFRNIAPPTATGLRSGVAPTAIKDPKLRAEYESTIEANRQKIRRNREQYRARDLKKYWIPTAERIIIWAYMDPPTGKDELKELETLLQKYVPDAGKRARILEAVEKKKMPDDLILRNTTQPAKKNPTTQPSSASK